MAITQIYCKYIHNIEKGKTRNKQNSSNEILLWFDSLFRTVMLKHGLLLLEWQSKMKVCEKEKVREVHSGNMPKTGMECWIFLLLISSRINN